MKIKILNIEVDKTNLEEVLSKVAAYLKDKRKFLIVTPNPEIALKANNDPTLAQIINSADISIPDGVGLKLVDSTLTIIKGRELMELLFELANERRLKIFLLGGTLLQNKRAVEAVHLKYTKLKVLAYNGAKLNNHGEPVNHENEALDKTAISKINEAKPDLLFIAFGAPKQEYWISKRLQKLNIGGAMVVGGALDYFSGSAKKPPEFMSTVGLEWLWRVLQEPSRIGRIWSAVIVFPLTLLKSKFF